MNRFDQRRRLFSSHDAAYYLGGIRVSHRSPFNVLGDTAAVC